MKESSEGSSRRYREGIFGALSVGAFFLLVGAIFATTPNLFDRIVYFFNHFELKRVPNLGEIWLPEPTYPRSHLAVYFAASQFSLIWSFFQIVIFVLRSVSNSPLNKKAETLSNFVVWLGTAFLINTFLIETTKWFVFWSGIMMLLGLSLIVRAIILAAKPTRRAT